jgi:ABC-type dipeptide/oligopeptide/nickel transport system ATPase component
MIGDGALERAVEGALARLGEVIAYRNYAIDAKRGTVAANLAAIGDRKVEGVLLEQVSLLLQRIVEVCGKRNVRKIEDLIDKIFSRTFYDKKLEFRIDTVVHRSVNVYKFTVIEDGLVEGLDNSFGGGVLAVLSVSLKAIFNLFTKRFPVLLLDESLSFLSEKYQAGFSALMKELAREFGLTVVLVTHQATFAESADIHHHVYREPFGPLSVRTEDRRMVYV